MALSALAGLGLPVLAGCDLPGASKDKAGAASPSGSTASAGGSASAGAAKAGSTEWQKLDGHVMGHKVSVEVSPVIRQDDKTSYIAVKLTRASDDASIDAVNAHASTSRDDKLNISNYLGVPSISRPGTGTSLVKLLDTASGRVWSATDGSGLFLELAPGEDMTSYLSFGKVDTDTVTVMVPMAGFTTVSVLDANDAKKAKIDLSIAQAALKQSSHTVPKLADPVAIERYTRALDDSTSTHAGGKDITVTLASDVTFASDSTDLAPGAEAQLKTIATQLGQHPDGGTLTIDHPEGKYSLKGPPSASPTSPSRTPEAYPDLPQGREVIPVLARGKGKDGDNRLLHSPPHRVLRRRLHRSQPGTPRTMGRCPRGGLAQSPGRTWGSSYALRRATTKNGVGRLPREETADAVVKEKGLRPW